jgi:plasmid replication initiation protein
MTKTFGAVRQKRIESIARPGETWEQADARLREKKSPLPGENKTTSSIRNPPASDAQRDFFVPTLYDVGTKDNRSIMDVAVFRLSKKDKRIGEVINYTLPDGHVTVSAGAAGMASVWDYDLVLMAISHLTEAMNRHREGKGVKPGRVFQPHIADVLRFCRRADGGKQKEDILDTCIRLNTTHVAVHRIKKSQNGQAETVDEGEALISRYKVIKSNTGKPVALEIELSDWMYREITEGKNPDVLTVHPDYFLIDPGIGRFIYRLARRAAGKGEARWSFQTIYEHSGSTGTIKKFTENLRKIIAANDLPEYNLREEKGLNGPILVMTYRTLIEEQTTKSP